MQPSNDYNDGTETFQIQGVQIMQSANGLTGNAINLNGATGAGGDSNATSGLTAWDPTDNDVLKIVDIGFVQSTSGTIDALLDFARSRGVTQIFIGHSQRSGLWPRILGNPVDQLIRRSRGMDVRVFPQ